MNVFYMIFIIIYIIFWEYIFQTNSLGSAQGIHNKQWVKFYLHLSIGDYILNFHLRVFRLRLSTLFLSICFKTVFYPIYHTVCILDISKMDICLIRIKSKYLPYAEIYIYLPLNDRISFKKYVSWLPDETPVWWTIFKTDET